MSPAQRVLLLDRDARRLRSLPRLLMRAGSDVIAETSATITGTLDRLRSGGYDAVLCRVDGPKEVAFLIRIKRAAPGIPVVAMTPAEDPALDDLARESGADMVQSAAADEPERGRAASLRALIDQTRATLLRSRELRREGRELLAEHRRMVARHRILAENRIDQIRKIFETFVPLVVEDDPAQITLMTQAFQRAAFNFPLPVMRDGHEAILYLSGKGPYADRARFPLPSLLVLDINVPRKTGLEVLEWVRSVARFDGLPVFMLTGAPQHFDQAMGLGATDYFVKPMEFRSLVDIVRKIAVRWWFLLQAGGSRKP